MSKRFQLIPARGRKPNTKDHILKIIVAFQLIPARGRKPICFGQIVERLGKFQLIPARGRKPVLLVLDDLVLWFQLIPARGRKLFNRYRNFELVLIFQLIPARGQKLAIDCLRINTDYISTYPRKGTETGSLPVGLHISLDFNLSPQGDGNIKKMIPDFTSLNYFNLSPQGGKKLRIKNGAEFFFCVP